MRARSTPRVAGFGDNVVDRFVDRGVLYPGGNCVNFAVYAAQLGVDSAYVGVLGTDDEARHIRSTLHLLGVDTSHCVVSPGATGWCDVRVVDGDRVFGDWAGGVVLEAPFQPTESDFAYLAGFDLVHVSAYAGLEPHLPALRARTPLISFDFSDEAEQRDPAYLDAVVPWIDLAIFSVADLDWTEAEEFARAVHDRGADLCLVTRGEEGSALFDGSAFHRVASVRVDPVDTMGAGDAFITAFTVSLLEAGWTRDGRPDGVATGTALTRAARFAADQCSIEGAFGYSKEFVQ
ncbi:PfkB family carbohydrate kinase [Microbacterium sp. 3J1]|uniref:PfkB family carbohydrate kinase n=1 Tax=Microbacterium sp. 3J1 TaxID=861269 RepID=UPI000AF4224A|nr:PfkB family carbohydrate kinase [Microbacterium sp. 3J1]